MRVEPELPPYADLVFHVLAHVRRTADLPSSVYDAAWVSHAEAWLGPAGERTLAEDAEALGVLVDRHADLAALQLLAWLFRDLERARATATRDLGALAPADVDAPELLAPLAALGPAVELLRLAAELEREHFSRLPAPRVEWGQVESALRGAIEVAPELEQCSVSLVRSLRLRGRVRGAVIWVGVPDAVLGPSLLHVGWQAAHEATVREVGRAAPAEERRVERMAVALLAARAERHGRASEHGVWLGHFGPNAPDTSLEALRADERRVVSELLRRSD